MISEEHRFLARRFGFNSPNASRRQRMYDRWMNRQPERKEEIEHAWKIAHSNEFQKHIAAKELKRRRMAQIKANTGHGVHSQQLNLAGEQRYRDQVAAGCMQIVGALQDLMKLSGSSLSVTIFRVIKKRYGSEVAGLTRLAGKALAASPKWLWAYVADLLSKQFGHVEITDGGFAEVGRRAHTTVSDIMAGKDTDLRPLVKAVILGLEPAYVKHMGHAIIQSFLQMYVEQGYHPSAGESSICVLCRYSAACSMQATNHAAHSDRSNKLGRALAKILDELFRGLNRLLDLEGTNVSKALRQAMDSNIREYLYFSGAVSRAAGPVMQVVSMAAKALRMVSLTRYMYPAVSAYLRKYGLEITETDLDSIVQHNLPALAAFISRDPHVNVEPIIRDVLVKARPVRLLSNIRRAATSGTSGEAFCKLCSAWACQLVSA